MREEINKVKDELEDVTQSFAFELLKDQRKQNKRQFIIILVLIACWFITGAYLVWLLNDISSSEITETGTIDIDNVEQIDGSTIKIGDDVWEKSE